MRNIVRGYERIINRIIQGGMWLSSVAISLMVLLLAIDVSMRTFISRVLPGTIEVVELLLVIVGFLTPAYASLVKGHVGVELISSKLPKRFQAILNSFSYLVGMAVFALMGWQIGLRAWENMIAVNTMNTPMLHISLTPFFVVAAAGSVLFALQEIVGFFHSVSETTKELVYHRYRDAVLFEKRRPR